MCRGLFIFFFLANALGCAAPANHSPAISECIFIHSAEAQPTYKNQLSSVSAHFYDDRISIQSDDSSTCELHSSGYLVDLVWLYPFHQKKLIYIEQSALGTKLNLVDVRKCAVIEHRETRGYRIEKTMILGKPDSCEWGEKNCEAFALFDISRHCK